MKHFILFIIFLSASILFSETIIQPGNVSGIWTAADSPYLIEGEITVPDEESLTIEPGVLVEFQGHYRFHVQGRLLAVGSNENIITFTINDTTNFHDLNLQEGAWQGIRFNNTPATNDSSKIIFCKIEFGKANGFDPPCSGNGGGIYVENFSKLRIQNSLISNNKALLGGGIAFDESNGVIISNTIISNNESYIDGGGIYCLQSSPFIDGGYVQENESSSGGGMSCWYNSSPIITNSVFEGNTSDVHGGGIFCKFGSSPELVDVILRENTSNYGAAANFNDDSNPLIIRTLITDNHSTNSSGAFSCGYDSHPIIINSTIVNNTADGSGGVSYIYDSHPIFVNSIVWNNTPEAFYFSDWDEFSNSITFAYSDIEGGVNNIVNSQYAAINWLAGNIDADPQFVNGDYDFNLSSNSPCIDSGVAFFQWNDEVLVDLFFDEYLGSAPDMGAFEWDNTFVEEVLEIIGNINNYPNPFNPTTTIQFSILLESHVDLSIYNVKGQKIKTVIQNDITKGSHSIIWNGNDDNGKTVSSGIYYYKLNVNGKTEAVKKCLLLK